MTQPQQLPEASKLPEGWTLTDKALQRVVEGADYLSALRLLYDIGQLAERENHHPDLFLHYKRLTIRFWTHTAPDPNHPVTALDYDLAEKVESLIKGGFSR